MADDMDKQIRLFGGIFDLFEPVREWGADDIGPPPPTAAQREYLHQQNMKRLQTEFEESNFYQSFVAVCERLEFEPVLTNDNLLQIAWKYLLSQPEFGFVAPAKGQGRPRKNGIDADMMRALAVAELKDEKPSRSDVQCLAIIKKRLSQSGELSPNLATVDPRNMTEEGFKSSVSRGRSKLKRLEESNYVFFEGLRKRKMFSRNSN